MEHNNQNQNSSHEPTTPKLHFLDLFPNVVIKKERCYALSFFIFLISSILLVNLAGPFEPRTLLGFRFSSRSTKQNNLNLSREACDYSHGKWVRDENYPIQLYDESCRFLDPGFRCRQNGRKDVEYLKWRWKPYGCDLPRYNLMTIHK